MKKLLNHPLPLLVHIEADKQIQNVKLKFHPEGFAFQIFGHLADHLESEIQLFLEHYISKKNFTVSFLNPCRLPVFSHQVLTYLMQIPFGSTLTYKQVAEAVGSPQAARAVGGACSRNPFLLFIPCHRVISSKSMCGFSNGQAIKKILINFEKNNL